MTSRCCRLIGLELRKRFDTRGSTTGYGFLALIVMLCGALSVSVVTRADSFAASEVVVTTGLAAALASSIVGAVVGVGDAGRGGEGDVLLGGHSRDAAFFARGAACIVVIAALVLFTAVVAAASAGVAVLLGGNLRSGVPLGAVGQVAGLSLSSAAAGFGIGSACRSLTLSVVTVVLVLLVVDALLGFLGDWSVFIRFSTVQSASTGTTAFLPTVTSTLLWIALPLLVGWVRTKRASA